MNIPNQTDSSKFPKTEKLCNRKRIDSLFESGSSFYIHPVKVYYTVSSSNKEDRAPVQLLISIPKRNIKKAVDRNRLKRLIRESYRIQKHQFIANCTIQNLAIDTAFVYTLRKQLEFKEIREIIFLILQRLNAICLQQAELDRQLIQDN
jgi:ribonuclease P protein component